MPKKMPPIPPESRSGKGSGIAPEIEREPSRGDDRDAALPDEKAPHLEQQGRHGNIRQNTRSQHHQEDR